MKRRRLTHRLSVEGLYRAAKFALYLQRHTNLSKEKILEVAEAASRRGMLTADGKLRKGARIPLL